MTLSVISSSPSPPHNHHHYYHRVLRIFKLGKYSDGSSLLVNTVVNSSPAMMLLAFFMYCVMLVSYGTYMLLRRLPYICAVFSSPAT